jgi:hypothetical protein
MFRLLQIHRAFKNHRAFKIHQLARWIYLWWIYIGIAMGFNSSRSEELVSDRKRNCKIETPII